ncbi:general transcriptional corepressor trfA-like isoform X2 [Daktulosphaira vitifoliae]|uniref:general transcriptional corepressor trfA-like isoform X2 n=1 Tax=Daktulosphaira vitifoliae TaxID=58002 RepID=UPI0021AAA5B6|nr:general transcriptional corepressor trfA-like isoform X2 [Daktulosphaira vitifoliae]
MNLNVNGISNDAIINYFDTIIQQESLKLKKDKENLRINKNESKEIMNENNNSQVSYSQNSHQSYLPKTNNLRERDVEIERLANLFTQSPSYFNSYNNNNNNIDFKHNEELLKKTPVLTHNNSNVLKNQITKNLSNIESQEYIFSIAPEIRKNVRFGEFSPHNPANQINAKPFLGIGEYDNKRKQLFEQSKNEYIEYLANAKQNKSTIKLPQSQPFSCEKTVKATMEEDKRSEKIDEYNKTIDDLTELTKRAPFIDGSESCIITEDELIKSNKTKQEIYRLELDKQIEEKKMLEQAKLQKQIMEDAAIEKEARERDEKLKKEYEREMQERALFQIHKRMVQEKLKDDLLEKQKSCENKNINFSKPVEFNEKDCINTYSSDYNNKQFEYLHQNSFDEVPLPTTRNLPLRKVIYKDTDAKFVELFQSDNISVNKKDTIENSCINQNRSPPLVRPRMRVGKNAIRLPKEPPSYITMAKNKPSHVSFADDTLLNNNFSCYSPKNCNPNALLSSKQSLIIDSPHTLALAGTEDVKENKCTSSELDEATIKYPNDSKFY